MNIKPMQGRILVKEVETVEKVKGGLYIPTDANNKSLIKAEVIRVGTPTPDYDCSDIKVGVEVLFVEYAAAEIDGEEGCRIVRYEDILGINER